MRDVILTSYLTGVPDPQWDAYWPVDAKPLRALAESCPVPLVVFANELADEFVETVAAPVSVYFDRWKHAARYLAAHEDIRYAWCVDATDVEVLNDPFPHMRPGVLYCGSEPEVLGCHWMRYHSEPMLGWIDAHADYPLLNCGLAGGDRLTLLRLCERMGEEQRGMVMDMGPFNLIAYEEFDIVTGPQVHTLYKEHETESPAWFRHK